MKKYRIVNFVLLFTMVAQFLTVIPPTASRAESPTTPHREAPIPSMPSSDVEQETTRAAHNLDTQSSQVNTPHIPTAFDFMPSALVPERQVSSYTTAPMMLPRRTAQQQNPLARIPENILNQLRYTEGFPDVPDATQQDDTSSTDTTPETTPSPTPQESQTNTGSTYRLYFPVITTGQEQQQVIATPTVVATTTATGGDDTTVVPTSDATDDATVTPQHTATSTPTPRRTPTTTLTAVPTDTVVVVKPEPTAVPTDTTIVVKPEPTDVPTDTTIVVKPEPTDVPTDTTIVVKPKPTDVTTDTTIVVKPKPTDVPSDTVVIGKPESTDVPTDTTIVVKPKPTAVPTDTTIVVKPEPTAVPTDTTIVVKPEPTDVSTDTVVISKPEPTDVPTDTTIVVKPESTDVPTDTTIVVKPKPTAVPTDTVVVVKPEPTAVPTDTTIVVKPEPTDVTTDTVIVVKPEPTDVPTDMTIVIAPKPTTPITTTPAPEETPVNSPNAVEMRVSSDQGGVLTSPDGTVQVVMPTGAVTSATTIRYAPLSEDAVAGFKAVGPAFQLLAWDEQGNRITHFQTPLTITVQYSPTAGMNEQAIALFYFKDNSYWQRIATTVHSDTNHIVAVIDHFTDFASLVGWQVGMDVGLCQGTTIHHGPNLAAHTTVPENDWLVRVMGGPRATYNQMGEPELWWDTNRRILDLLPTSGTGWVNEVQYMMSCGVTGEQAQGYMGLAPYSPQMRALLRRLGFLPWMEAGLDPVTSSGNFVQQKTDLHVPGVAGFDLDLTRTYNSQDERDGPFGVGWSSVLTMYLRFANDGSVDVRYPDGHGAWFMTEDGTSYTPGDKGIYDTLKMDGEELVLTTPDQTSYYFNHPKGQLLRMKDRHDNTITFERDDTGNATSITDSAGRTYSLDYDDKNHVTKIAAPGGRTFTYAYNDKGDLTSFTDANGGVFQYAYNDEHLMTSLTDPENITYLQNTYDDKRRVTEQIDASGSLSKGIYSNSQTIFTDNLNNTTTIEFDDRDRVTKIMNTLGHAETFVYDENDNVTSYTDKNGNTWTSSHDERGNTLTSTDPQGHTVTFTYNSTNDLTSVTDEGGVGGAPRTTTFTVNDKGDVTGIGLPNGTTIDATYDGKGQLLTVKNPRGFVTKLTWDGEGNLVNVVDPLAHATSYTFNALGRETSTTDANGHTVTFTLDNNDNITRITDPKGQHITMTYDKNNLLVRKVDRRGGVWLYAYDENLKLVAETDPEGHKTTHAYDKMYNRVSTTDARGNTTLFRYDAVYQLVVVEDALQGKATLVYDPNGNITNVTNALGYPTNIAYDSKDQPVKITDALNGVTTMTYDAVGRTTSETNPRGATTRTEYDVLDQVVKVTDALGGEWTTTYDANGNVVAFTDANSHTTTTRYDAADRPIEKTDPEGHTTQIAFDAVGNVVTITNARGFVTSHVYDANNNLVEVTEPKVIDGQHAISRGTYDAENEIVAVTDPNGHTTTFTRNLDGLIVILTEAGGQQTHFDYDATHNLVTVTNAKGNAWHMTYDALNRQVSETDPLDHSTHYEYDALSRPIRTIDANGIATRNDYDALNRLVAVVQNDRPGAASDYETNVTTSYGYDAVSNLIRITDANGNVNTFEFDLLDRFIKETNPLTNTWVFTYDKVGNIITRTDAENQTTAYTYDKDDLLIEKSYPDSTSIQFGYDAVHNQTVMTDTIGITHNTYDEVNQLYTSTISPTTLVAASTKAVTYTYDLDGNVVAFAHPDGRVVRYVFDNTDYLTGVIDPDTHVFTATRDLTHNIIKVENPNDTYVERDIDAAERLTAVRNYTNQNPHEVVSRFEYTLDPVGNRTRVESEFRWRKPTNLNYDYTYDPLYRLTKSTDSEDHFTNYGYDAVGNRLLQVTNDDPTLKREVDVMTTTLTFNAANQMMTTVREVMPRGNADRTEQTGQALWAFVHEVAAQSGKHIDTATATSLISDSIMLMDALDAKKPLSVEDAATTIDALRSTVVAAGDTGAISNSGTVTSLLAKLRHTDDANAERGPELHVAFYDYDKNGNRIRRTEHRDISATQKDWFKTDYSYDYENRITHVQDFHTPGTPGNGEWLPMDETFVYFDGYGRVFRRQHDQHIAGGGQQEWVDYAYDGLDPIAEYDHPSHQYTNYHRGFGHILSMHEYKSQASPEGTLYYFHYDGLDSVVGITKHQGQSVHNLRYHDYGIILDINGQAADSSNFTDPHNHYTYTGQEWDEHINLYHFYARDYEPATGVWLQQDPYRGRLMEPKTLHRYGYVGGNPVTYVDAYGYDTRSSTDIGEDCENDQQPIIDETTKNKGKKGKEKIIQSSFYDSFSEFAGNLVDVSTTIYDETEKYFWETYKNLKGNRINISAYTKQNGVKVSAHSRTKPGVLAKANKALNALESPSSLKIGKTVINAPKWNTVSSALAVVGVGLSVADQVIEDAGRKDLDNYQKIGRAATTATVSSAIAIASIVAPAVLLAPAAPVLAVAAVGIGVGIVGNMVWDAIKEPTFKLLGF